MNCLENKSILVTGAHGFIGTHLAVRLARIAGVKIYLLSRQTMQTTQPNVVWLRGELGQLNQVYWQTHDISQIDYVFHLGGFIPKLAAESNRIDQAINDNILGTRALLEGLPSKIEKLIFSSTVDVYSQGEHDGVLEEGSKIKPSTLYGASKLFCESLILAWAKENGCEYAVLRYGHIYGPGEELYGKLIPVAIRNLLANQQPTVHGDGSALRDYLYVGDAVEATVRAACIEGNIGPINIVRGVSVTLKEIVQLLIRLMGCTSQINFLPDKPNGNSLRFDNSMMTKLLGHWPMTSLENGLAAEVEAFRRIHNVQQ